MVAAALLKFPIKRFNMRVAFHIRFAIFLSNLTKISPIVTTREQFLEIQDGGCRTVEFC